MNDEVRRYLEKADHALLVAEELLERGHAPDAASKTYYAMFYAAKALLLSEGFEVVKHSAVESWDTTLQRRDDLTPNTTAC